MKHGYGGYVRGCRCRICRDAQRAYFQQFEVKAKRRAYYQQPEVKAKQRAYFQQFEVKAKRRAKREEEKQLIALARTVLTERRSSSESESSESGAT